MRPHAGDWVAILDFGSQYSQLIARRVREASVFCEVFPPGVPASELSARRPAGIILSGGPASVYETGAPSCDEAIFRLGVPVLGICYGMQLGCRALGGRVLPAARREFGPAEVRLTGDGDGLFAGTGRRLQVWMSHGDRVEAPSRTFRILARTRNAPHAAIRHRELPFYGVQFHPEVHHTPRGAEILRNFLFRICKAKPGWKVGALIRSSVEEMRRRVGPRGKILCALSGGVDSTVTAVLAHRAVGDRLACVFVDNGLLRLGEVEQVRGMFGGRLKLPLRVVNAQERFLSRLRGVTDPERKRKVIGHTFIDVFRDVAKSIPGLRWLAQGTLYPDVIESRSALGGPSATIKTHHNVGGLPARLGFKLLEPLRWLFKDEVRRLGRSLGIPAATLGRQPFPGPGLAVRILGEVTRERLDVLRRADAILVSEVERTKLHRRLWQYFVVLLPVSSVGVMGDARTYENVVAVRAVESVDGMTADWARLPPDLLARISGRMINEVRGINRVVVDISSKPPATIEWE